MSYEFNSNFTNINTSLFIFKMTMTTISKLTTWDSNTAIIKATVIKIITLYNKKLKFKCIVKDCYGDEIEMLFWNDVGTKFQSSIKVNQTYQFNEFAIFLADIRYNSTAHDHQLVAQLKTQIINIKHVYVIKQQQKTLECVSYDEKKSNKNTKASKQLKQYYNIVNPQTEITQYFCRSKKQTVVSQPKAKKPDKEKTHAKKHQPLITNFFKH